MSYAAVPVPGNASLDQPLYGASIGQAIQRFFKKYATFSGRASRSEYWWVFLASFIVFGILGAISGAGLDFTNPNDISFGPAYWVTVVLSLALLVPSLAITWRRLHDTNKSGGFFFLYFIPLVGTIILIVLCAMQSDPQGQRFDR